MPAHEGTAVASAPVELRPGAAVGRIDLPAGSFGGGGTATLQMEVTRIDGPSPQGFVLAVSLAGGLGAPVELGRVSPYPVDRGGTFMLPVSADLARTAGRWAEAWVCLELLPAADGAALPGAVTATARVVAGP
jgi:hypothetical protein